MVANNRSIDDQDDGRIDADLNDAILHFINQGIMAEVLEVTVAVSLAAAHNKSRNEEDIWAAMSSVSSSDLYADRIVWAGCMVAGLVGGLWDSPGPGSLITLTDAGKDLAACGSFTAEAAATMLANLPDLQPETL